MERARHGAAEVMSTRGLSGRGEFFRGLDRTDSLGPSDSGASNGRLVSQAAVARTARSARIKDARQSWKVVYPLRAVLLPVVCGTIASGDDDDDDIVDWGEAHLSFLPRFSEFHHGVPCADWLRP
jgi:DDE_Tnp_1-associated